ncbi:unnamed protein product, partial [Didymodactylos carnosus]
KAARAKVGVKKTGAKTPTILDKEPVEQVKIVVTKAKASRKGNMKINRLVLTEVTNVQPTTTVL